MYALTNALIYLTEGASLRIHIQVESWQTVQTVGQSRKEGINNPVMLLHYIVPYYIPLQPKIRDPRSGLKLFLKVSRVKKTRELNKKIIFFLV